MKQEYPALEGTLSQIEWAEMIRVRVDGEFDRVAAAFRAVGLKQGERDRAETEQILAILEEKRAAVLARASAGYFIQTWQELTDQVRLLIFHDPRYAAIGAARKARKTA